MFSACLTVFAGWWFFVAYYTTEPSGKVYMNDYLISSSAICMTLCVRDDHAELFQTNLALTRQFVFIAL